MKYKCLKNQKYSIKQYALITLRYEDIFKIKHWRNKQMNILRQNRLLTDRAQELYFNNVILPSINMDEPALILFSYLFNNECIGYGGLTNIDWISKRAEISFLIDNMRITQSYEEDFEMFLFIIKRIAFDDLNFNRLFTETFDIRPLHISILEKNGFKFEGRLRQHIYIENEYVDSLMHGCLKEDYLVHG